MNEEASTAASLATAAPLSPLDQQKLRQLAHDMRSSLSVISMGLQLLAVSRQSQEEFEEMCEMMQSRGIDTLTQQIDAMAALYRRQ